MLRLALFLIVFSTSALACSSHTIFTGDGMLICTTCCTEFGCTTTCV